MTAWGEDIGQEPEGIETGVSETGSQDVTDPTAIDINTMTTQEFLALADWQWTTVLTQIVAELGAVQRQRAELAEYYYAYKGLQERERNLAQMKSACQSIMRTQRD